MKTHPNPSTLPANASCTCENCSCNCDPVCTCDTACACGMDGCRCSESAAPDHAATS